MANYAAAMLSYYRHTRMMRTQLLAAVLELAMKNHEAQIRVESSYQDKAQRTSTVASVFLAGAFGFARPDILQLLWNSFGPIATIVFSITIALLVLAVLFCVSVMWARRPGAPVSAFAIEPALRDVLVLSDSEIVGPVHEEYLETQLALWKARLLRYAAILKRERRLLFVGQLMLFLAIVAAAFLLALLVVASARAGR